MVACGKKCGWPAPSVAARGSGWGKGDLFRIQELDQVHLVAAYGKDQKDDVSADDKKAIRRFVQILTPIWHARSAGRPTRSARRGSSQALEAAIGSVPRFGTENVPTGTAAEDLTGWKNVRPDNGSDWRVVDGILEGRGANGERGVGSKNGGTLVSDRRNFTNFVLRVTMRLSSKPWRANRHSSHGRG